MVKKGRKIHCANHNLWGRGGPAALKLDLGTRPQWNVSLIPRCFNTA